MSIVIDSPAPGATRPSPEDSAPISPIAPHRRRRAAASDYRILVFGPEEFTGRGPANRDLPFSGLLARDISRSLGDGVDFSSVVVDGAMPRQLERSAADCELGDADAVVLVVGDEPYAPSPLARPAAVRHLIAAVRDRMTEEACLVVAVHGAGLAAELDRVVAAERGGRATGATTVVHLEEATAGSSSAARTERWAQQVAGPLLEQRRPSGWWLDPMTIDESSRSRQARRVQQVGPATVRELQRVVDAACEAYGTRSGGVDVLIGGTATFLASRNLDVTTVPREQTLCHSAVMEGRDLVIADARRDARFSDLVAVQEGEVGFYAGSPLRTPGGFRIGTLCVWDPESRRGVDGTLLRRLAREVEAILCLDVAVSRPTPRAGDLWPTCERCA